MEIVPLDIPGAFHLKPAPFEDDRGRFTRTFCRESFARHGLTCDWAQTNLSVTRERGTVRGLHFQTGDAAEDKLICCVAGAVFDVLLDLRPESPTFGQWQAVKLNGNRHDAIYAPAGLAHGFQTLTDDAMLHYSHSHPFDPDRQGGVHHADPQLAIAWPLPVSRLSERDSTLPPFARPTECTT